MNPVVTDNEFDNLSQDKVVNKFVPSHSDFLVAYSTLANRASIRNRKEGSWFIQEICNEFEKNYQEDHLHEMLIKAKGRVVQLIHRDQLGPTMQQPIIEDGLNKLVYFTQ